MNDLLVSTDSGASAILVASLDLTADFDTVCHSILLNGRKSWLDISGTVLK